MESEKAGWQFRRGRAQEVRQPHGQTTGHVLLGSLSLCPSSRLTHMENELWGAGWEGGAEMGRYPETERNTKEKPRVEDQADRGWRLGDCVHSREGPGGPRRDSPAGLPSQHTGQSCSPSQGRDCAALAPGQLLPALQVSRDFLVTGTGREQGPREARSQGSPQEAAGR